MTSTQTALLKQIEQLNFQIDYSGNNVSVYTQDISLDILEALSGLRAEGLSLEDVFYTNWSYNSVELTIPKFMVI